MPRKCNLKIIKIIYWIKESSIKLFLIKENFWMYILFLNFYFGGNDIMCYKYLNYFIYLRGNLLFWKINIQF